MSLQPIILHLDSDQPAQLYMYQRILLFPFGRWQAQVLVSLTTCMSDEHVSYKANLQTASTESRATMGPQAKCFSDGVFCWAKSGPILRAHWELVISFWVYMHLFPDPGYGEVPQEIERL